MRVKTEKRRGTSRERNQIERGRGRVERVEFDLDYPWGLKMERD